MADNEGADFIELTADIVSAYVSNNSVPASDLPALIAELGRRDSSGSDHAEG